MGFYQPLAVPDEQVVALADLCDTDRLVINSLRFWLASTEGKSAVWGEYSRRFGAGHGRRTLKSFEHLLIALAKGTVRHLIHRPCQCGGVSEDERTIAALVSHAALGETAQAIACASVIARPEAVLGVVEAARLYGEQALLRSAPRTLH